MIVVQCWDDGVVTDIRLTEIFKKHNAKATFNLNAGLHEKYRQSIFVHKGNNVIRLGRQELKDVYEGFDIANHSLTHPYLDKMPVIEAMRDIVEGRKRLQQLLGRSVLGFVYPFGAYNPTVIQLVREAGHFYARTGHSADHPFPPPEPMLFHPSCHFLASDFWSRYEQAKQSGVFYFWGHSYEMITDSMWNDFENNIRRISEDTQSCWKNVIDLFLP